MAFNIRIPFVVATHIKKITALTGIGTKSKAAGIGVLSGTLYVHNGLQAQAAGASLPLNTYAADAAITLTSQVALLTKGSAAAMTVAAPGANGVGTYLVITSGSNFAHVITFTGGTLGDGTTGLNTTVTMTAFIGSSIVVYAISATTWVVLNQENLTSVA